MKDVYDKQNNQAFDLKYFFSTGGFETELSNYFQPSFIKTLIVIVTGIIYFLLNAL